MKSIIKILILFVTYTSFGQDISAKYSILIKEIITKRDAFMFEYENSNSIKKDSIILDARNYLIHTMATELFPYWYGTKWDFNGTTRIPRKGRIACGYFVTNVLTDVGFNIPRIKWAQSASEVFIKKLANNKVKRFTNEQIANVEKYLINSGNGLYLVGLDNHTGFIYVNNKEVRFIHADYYEPEKGVVSEKLGTESPITDSAYRVIGKLMSRKMILSWINKQAIN